MIYLLLFTQLWAQEVLIQGPKTSDFIFEKQRIEAANSESYIQHHQRQVRLKESLVLSILKKAQYEFLKGSLGEANTYFLQLAKLRHQENWSSQIRKTFHYAMLRLAQGNENELDRKKWLREAILYDATQVIEENLFPPPLVSEYHLMLKQIPIEVWSLPLNHNSFTNIFLNGKEIKSSSSFLHHRKGLVRVSFLSNKFQPIEVVTDIENLKDLKIVARPIASGPCHSPRFTGIDKIAKSIKLIEPDCSNRPIQAIHQFDATEKPPQRGENAKSPSLLKSKWLWVGVGVIASGLAWNHLQKSKQGGNSVSSASREPIEIRN